VPEIGFGAKFLDLNDFQKEFLHDFAELHYTYR